MKTAVRAKAARTKTERYYSAHNVATTVGLTRRHQAESSWAFHESYTADRVGSCARAIDHGQTKGEKKG